LDELFVEQPRLNSRCGGGLATSDANDTEDGYFAKGCARHEDAVGIGVEVGRRDLDSVVEKRKQIVRSHALQGFTIEKAEAKPQAIEFRPAEKSFALRFEVVIEISDKVDGANLREGKRLVLAARSQKIERVQLSKPDRIQVSPKGLSIVELDNHLLVGGSWGAEFQRTGFPSKTGNLH
jgi:hypothetical protein